MDSNSSQQGQATTPIHVLVGGEAKQLFEQFRDPRVRLISPQDVGELEPDLVVVPCGTPLTMKLPQLDVPDRVWASAAAGRTGVIFDASAEGRVHTPQRTEVMHGFLRARGISPAVSVYLTQERNYRADYLAHCAELGAAPPMSVVLHDYWIWRFAAQFEAKGRNILEQRLEYFRARPAMRPRRFISLNYTPRATKLLFLLSLIRDGLWDQGFISFGGFEQFERTTGQDMHSVRRVMQRLEGFEDLAAELAPRMDALAAYGQVMLGEVARDAETRRVKKSPFRDPKMDEFDQSWFTVITETEMRSWASRITEKPLKPLVNFHPLVTFGNPGALQMIRDLGFHTFGDVIDESYDLELDPRRRFEMVYREVQRLCALDEADLARMEVAISGKLEANASWGLVDLPRARRTLNDTALMDQIMAAVRRPAAVAGVD